MTKWVIRDRCEHCNNFVDDDGYCTECQYGTQDDEEEEDSAMNPKGDALRAMTKQVGGTHYKDMAIQPVEFIIANGLGFCEGNIIKYTCRYKQKNGVEDLRKVIHYAEMLIASLES
jgi:hypothetical protein